MDEPRHRSYFQRRHIPTLMNFMNLINDLSRNDPPRGELA
jgi:hypothetical protein